MECAGTVGLEDVEDSSSQSVVVEAHPELRRDCSRCSDDSLAYLGLRGALNSVKLSSLPSLDLRNFFGFPWETSAGSEMRNTFISFSSTRFYILILNGKEV